MKRTIRWDRIVSLALIIAFAVSCAINGTENTVNAVFNTVLAPIDAEFEYRDAQNIEWARQAANKTHLDF